MWRSKVHLSCLSSGYFDFTRHSFVWVVLDLDHLLLIPRLRCSLWVLLLGLFNYLFAHGTPKFTVSFASLWTRFLFGSRFWSFLIDHLFIPVWDKNDVNSVLERVWIILSPFPVLVDDSPIRPINRFIFNFIRIQSTIWTTLWICNPDLINLIEYFN